MQLERKHKKTREKMAEVGWRNLNVVFRQAGYILAGGEKTNKYQQHGVVSSIGQRLPRRTR